MNKKSTIEEQCEICKPKTPPRPVVFVACNEKVAMDLKQWNGLDFAHDRHVVNTLYLFLLIGRRLQLTFNQSQMNALDEHSWQNKTSEQIFDHGDSVFYKRGGERSLARTGKGSFPGWKNSFLNDEEIAKQTELSKLHNFDTYEECDDIGQNALSTRWVITTKDNQTKARLVVRGFEEEFTMQRDNDKRLRIDIAAIAESLASKEVNNIKWCPGDKQLANCMTKFGASSYELLQVIQTGKMLKDFV
ncbi:unnamed protein product [Mytilus coruscus]|uniref:Uncharacterized protein n=1 Tax=Mytilus coruscus TaxID=42192 RepID=A0A6J8DSM8_MYTCO|nr:unnamed protein product [Mytilus coruscus]